MHRNLDASMSSISGKLAVGGKKSTTCKGGKFLIDTHIVLWALFEPDKLQARIKDLLTDPDNYIFVSSISLWEIAIKYSIGKLEINKEAFDQLPKVIDDTGFLLIQPEYTTYLKFADIPNLHGDPFDRLLIAQALYENFCLVTMDNKIKELYKGIGIRIF